MSDQLIPLTRTLSTYVLPAWFLHPSAPTFTNPGSTCQCPLPVHSTNREQFHPPHLQTLAQFVHAPFTNNSRLMHPLLPSICPHLLTVHCLYIPSSPAFKNLGIICTCPQSSTSRAPFVHPFVPLHLQILYMPPSSSVLQTAHSFYIPSSGIPILVFTKVDIHEKYQY